MSKRRITFDFETRSEADLTQVGAWAYSEHPSTEVICAAWGIDRDPIRSWDMRQRRMVPGFANLFMDARQRYVTPELEALFKEIANGAELEAHNVAFERAIWTNVCAKRMGWPLPPDDCWRDTMAVASYYALPAKLDSLARALGFQGKDSDGGRLITRYSKLHLKTAKREIPDADVDAFVRYCRQDVRIEQSVSDYLGDLPDRELPVFQLDQKINLRGLHLDLDGIEDATAILEQRSDELTEEFEKKTGGIKPTQNAKIIAWAAGQGVVLENLQKDYLSDLLEEDNLGQGPVRRAIQIRLDINKASTKKLDAMARQRGADGRARFQVRYHGAATGRWTGTGFQPLNLNRGFGDDVAPEDLVRAISYRDPRWLDCLYGSAMEAIAKAARHWIQAQHGRKIVAGDFVSIEAVLLACLAGEGWKVRAFAEKKPVYEIMGCKIHGMPEELAIELGKGFKEKYPAERQDGKTGELAFGYQGALGAWLKFDDSGRHTDERIIEICKSWRREHPMIVQFWRDLEDAAVQAVMNPEQVFQVRQIGFQTWDEMLSMILPNGKRIWYFRPQIRMVMPRWHEPGPEIGEDGKVLRMADGEIVMNDCAKGTCRCRPRPQVSYMAQKEGQWKRVTTYGGKLAENATQATSREVLVPAMLRAEAAGYPIILSVYDEIVAEPPLDFGSEKEFSALMAESPGDWATGWPIMVDGWEGDRYKK